MTNLDQLVGTKCYKCTVLHSKLALGLQLAIKGRHGGRVVTLSLFTSEVRVRFRALPQVGKLVVARRCSAVYSTEP